MLRPTMGEHENERSSLRQGRLLPAAVVVLTLCVMGLAIGWVTRQLRGELRQQVAGRDAEALGAVVMAQLSDPASDEDLVPLEDPISQLQAVLNASRLRGVIAVRLYDREGEFQSAFPLRVTEGTLAAADRALLRQGQKVSRLHPRARLGDLFLMPKSERDRSTNTAPVLEVIIPILGRDRPELGGIAQFFVDGQSIATEFRQLDRHLLHHGLYVFVVGGGATALGLIWAFQRLRRTHRLLAQRTTDLAAANRELTLAAKTSAVGALTSQLIHGLKSPLFGLQSFLEARHETSAQGDPEWQVATRTARQMQTLIADLIRVLRESKGITQYEITLPEFVQVLGERFAAIQATAGVGLRTSLETEGVLPNQAANLTLLIVENLVQNALQATPPGGTVRLRVFGVPQGLAFSVCDQGPGVPPFIQAKLFTPCTSTKPNGSGIGLAISKQLANHLGAELSLCASTPDGSEFRVILPAGLLSRPAAQPTQPAIHS